MIHGELPSGPADLWNHWPVRASIVLPLVAGMVVYARGVDRLWKRAGVGRPITRARVVSFMAGNVVLGLALVTPLDPLGEVLFSAHMIQHLLLILAAAPLLVAGAPEVAVMWALPQRARRRVGRWFAPLQRAGEDDERGTLLALGSVAIATLVLWIWHAPALYDLAVRNELVHATEHAAFLLTAVLFWATVLRVGRRAQAKNGIRFLLVFAMAVQGSVLGALITFAQRPLYEAHANIPAAWGINPVPDQHLAGLIMWVPPALVYIGVAAYLFVRWLEEIERRSREREARSARAAATEPAGASGSAKPAPRSLLPLLLLLVPVLAACNEDSDRLRLPEEGRDTLISNIPDGFLPALPPDTPMTVAAGALRSPETALWDSVADVYLVSNINGKLTAADGNGFISRISPHDSVLDLQWISGASGATLHGPKGMVFRDASTLAVADVGAVRFFDRTTGAAKGSVPIPEAYMLNDLAVGADGALYVSDVGDAAGKHPGAIYRIDGGSVSVVVEGDHLERPDGILPDGDGLLVASFAPHARDVYRLTPDGRRIPVVRLPEGQLDGLLRLPDGSLLVTSWGGNAVYRVQGDDVQRLAGGMVTPAQIGYDARRRRVLVPVLKQNLLLVYELRPTAKPKPN